MAVDPGTLLREHGLRVTPQRRAILAAFDGTPAEHLTADEIHARAAAEVPEIGRGTVYATLAELTELGLLGSYGSPEPQRYERNTDRHDHFRCRLCLRLFDIAARLPRTDALKREGFDVERVEVLAEGVCAECTAYDDGLRRGARRMLRSEQLTPGVVGTLACVRSEGTLGPLMVAATPDGLARVAFEDHADFAALAERASTRRGGKKARENARHAAQAIEGFLGGSDKPIEDLVDWETATCLSPAAVEATRTVAFGTTSSYELLEVSDLEAFDCGISMGTNPIPVVLPCHRVTRGATQPEAYIGGPERRRVVHDLEQ